VAGLRLCAVYMLTKAEKQEYSSAVHNVCCAMGLKAMSRDAGQGQSFQLCFAIDPGANHENPFNPQTKA